MGFTLETIVHSLLFATENHKRDGTIVAPPTPRDLVIKLEVNFDKDEFLALNKLKAKELRYHDCTSKKSHQPYLALLFLEQARHKFEELCIDLENDWNTGTNNFPHTIDCAYTLLGTFRGITKFILIIIKK